MDEHDPVLLAEMKYLGDSLRSNEEMGDGRLNILLAITAVGGAGIVALLESRNFNLSSAETSLCVAFIVIVLFFGWQTFSRIVDRNRQTDWIIARLSALREHFIANGVRRNLLEWPHSNPRHERSMNPLTKGGLAEQTMAINSVILSVGVALVASQLTESSLATSAIFAVTLVVAYMAQAKFARRRYRKNYG